MNRPSLQYFRRLAAKAPRGQFWLFFTASLFFSFGFSIFFFLFNLYLLGFHFTERSLGLIGGFMAFGSILGTIPAGICAERFGIRRTLVSGLLCTVVFSVLRICFLAQPAQFGLATPHRHDPMFLGGLSLSRRRQPDSRAGAPIRFQSHVLLRASVVAALGALVAGQLPGWLRHLPQDSPIHCGRGHPAHARVCLWRSSSFDRSPTRTEACPERLHGFGSRDFRIPFCADFSRRWRSGPWLPAPSRPSPMCISFTTWDLSLQKDGLRLLARTAGPVSRCALRSSPASAHGAGQGCRF